MRGAFSSAAIWSFAAISLCLGFTGVDISIRRSVFDGTQLATRRTESKHSKFHAASKIRRWSMSTNETSKTSLFSRGIQRLIRGRNEKRLKEKTAELPTIEAIMEAMASNNMDTVYDMPLPSHPQMKCGVLPNKLQYVILPNASPPGRFEAHMEVFAGSADELDKQQGMAHIVEHIAYMGSRKRERLFGTGSQTNAYTDYHHTVFYASCPVLTPPGIGKRKSMLPMALDALCDVLEAKCEPSRLEKERAAVLSEMTMVNTIDYRVECQVLAALHAENILSRRFPIGKEELIRAWQVDDIKEFHRAHYRTDNAIVYIIGEVDVSHCEEQLQKIFGHLQPSNAPSDPSTLKHLSNHFPPVTHKWSGGKVTEKNSLPIMDTYDGKPLDVPRIFTHNLLQAFSFHLFAKRPIEPIKTFGDFRNAIMKRIALAALQPNSIVAATLQESPWFERFALEQLRKYLSLEVFRCELQPYCHVWHNGKHCTYPIPFIRLSVNNRTDPPFNMIEFNYVDSPREACAVCSLDMTADPLRWREAILIAIREIRRLGMYGVTEGELSRFGAMLLTDAQQLAAQGDRVMNGEQLTFLMAAVSSSHVFMDSKQTYEAMRLVIDTLTPRDVLSACREICEHMMEFGVPGAPQPSAILACIPSKENQSAEQEEIDESILLEAILEGGRLPIDPPLDTVVPLSLFTEEELAHSYRSMKPSFVPFAEKEKVRKGIDTVDNSAFDAATEVVQRRLNNGIRVNIRSTSNESQAAQMRIMVPGGRQLETIYGSGSVAVGARTMQEGGAVEGLNREQVELFCHDYFIMVAIDASEEFLWIDLSFPTCKPHSRKVSNEEEELTGMEAGFQVANQILSGYKWEEDALKRAKQAYYQLHETSLNSLEGWSAERLMSQMSGADSRFLSVPHHAVRSLALDDVKKAIMSQLTTDHMEISISGDFSIDEVERLVLQYLGTVPPSQRSKEAAITTEDIPMAGGNPERHVDVHLPDSDDRAVAYVSGICPNKWGVMRNGKTVKEVFDELEPNAPPEVQERRNHSLFPSMSLALLKEVINRRLFSTVREQMRLTYDANFHILSFERLNGSWYLLTVTANPSKAQAALEACKDTLHKLTSSQPITFDNVDNAKRVVINRHENDKRTNKYWCELMSGIQAEHIPMKDASCIRDFVAVANSITAKDLQLLLNTITIEKDEMFSCVGVSGADPYFEVRPAD